MKRTGLKTWTTALVLFVVAGYGAYAQSIINYFYMKGEVCAPVTLKTSQGTFVVGHGDSRHALFDSRLDQRFHPRRTIEHRVLAVHVEVNE